MSVFLTENFIDEIRIIVPNLQTVDLLHVLEKGDEMIDRGDLDHRQTAIGIDFFDEIMTIFFHSKQYSQSKFARWAFLHCWLVLIPWPELFIDSHVMFHPFRIVEPANHIVPHWSIPYPPLEHIDDSETTNERVFLVREKSVEALTRLKLYNFRTYLFCFYYSHSKSPFPLMLFSWAWIDELLLLLLLLFSTSLACQADEQIRVASLHDPNFRNCLIRWRFR